MSHDRAEKSHVGEMARHPHGGRSHEVEAWTVVDDAGLPESPGHGARGEEGSGRGDLQNAFERWIEPFLE